MMHLPNMQPGCLRSPPTFLTNSEKGPSCLVAAGGRGTPTRPPSRASCWPLSDTCVALQPRLRAHISQCLVQHTAITTSCPIRKGSLSSPCPSQP